MSIVIASLHSLWVRIIRSQTRKTLACTLRTFSHAFQTAIFACFEKCDQLIFRWQDWRQPPAHHTRQQP